MRFRGSHTKPPEDPEHGDMYFNAVNAVMWAYTQKLGGWLNMEYFDDLEYAALIIRAELGDEEVERVCQNS